MSATERCADRSASIIRRGQHGRTRNLEADAFERHRFKKTRTHDYVCHTWFERDRAHIRLETPTGRVVFELWDEDVGQAIEDGFLTAPRVPRPSDPDWQPHAVRYALDRGLISLA